jgi:hypothetical protein
MSAIYLCFRNNSNAAEIRLLFIGNSYTTSQRLDQSVKKLLELGVPAYREVLVHTYAPSGYRWEQHRQDAEGSKGETALHKYLVSEQYPDYKWNYVLLQEQSQIAGFGRNDAYWQASLQSLKVLDQFVRQRGGQSVLVMTWGRHKGDPLNQELYPDFKTMQQRLTDGYRAYAAEIGATNRRLFIAPVGLAWEKVYDDIVTAQGDPLADDTRFTQLYTDDGSHPSVSGSYLAACVIYAALIGRDPSDINWYPDGSLPPAERRYLQDVARRVVLERAFAEDAYPWAFEWADYTWPVDTMQPSTKAISSVGARHLVRLKDDAGVLQSLDIAVTHQGKQQGDGRLRIENGGKLVLGDVLNLGVSGFGHIEQTGGKLQAAKLVMGIEGSARGQYVLADGELQVGEILAGQGQCEFVMKGGKLMLREIGISLHQQGGILAAHTDGDVIKLTGDYQLGANGSIEIKIAEQVPNSNQHTALIQISGIAQIAGNIRLRWDGHPSQLEHGQWVSVIQARKIALTDGWKLEAPQTMIYRKITTPDQRENLEVAIASSDEINEHPDNTEYSSEAPTNPTSETNTENVHNLEHPTHQTSDANTQDQEINLSDETHTSVPTAGCCQANPPTSSTNLIWFLMFCGCLLALRKSRVMSDE